MSRRYSGPVRAGARPRRRRGVRAIVKLLIVLAVIAGLLEIADVITRHMAEDTISSRATKATGASSANSSISGWPLLYDVFADNSVPGVAVTLHQVPIGPLQVDEIAVQLTEVGVDSHDLVSKRSLRLTGISRADVTAVVTAAELSSASGHRVQLSPRGKVEVDLGGTFVAATVQIVTGHVLVLEEDGHELVHVDLAQDRMVPDCSMSFGIAGGEVTARCSVSPVPASLLSAFSGPA